MRTKSTRPASDARIFSRALGRDYKPSSYHERFLLRAAASTPIVIHLGVRFRISSHDQDWLGLVSVKAHFMRHTISLLVLVLEPSSVID